MIYYINYLMMINIAKKKGLIIMESSFKYLRKQIIVSNINTLMFTWQSSFVDCASIIHKRLLSREGNRRIYRSRIFK